MSAHLFPPAGHRLYVIVGPYGSGKTEVAINLALRLAAQGRHPALADLDIVNPYFRSREKTALLEAAGVRVIAPSPATAAADLPALPAAVWQAIMGEDLTGVLDVGGDRNGARVLAGFAPQIEAQRPAMWYVLNRARPDNRSLHQALRSLREIEAYAGLRVNGILSNSHLLHETTADLVRDGAAFAQEVAHLANLPIVCHAVPQALADELHDLQPQLPLTLYMNRPWETS